MMIGYGRVSQEKQVAAAQATALQTAGCERIFEEKASGGRWDRPQLQRILDQLQPGDVVCVWKLDRLSRSLKDLLHILERIEEAEAGFRSLEEAIDTTTPAGRMLMQMLRAVAEFERSMVRERTRVGLEEARKRGSRPGRRRKLDANQSRAAITMVRSGEKTPADVARIFRVHPSTIGRLMARVELEEQGAPPAKTS